ncbi:GPI-anchored wall transfer protein 1 [Wickerhamomyces ciferrii]|uniref:GPI-anchored wall transfer protein n=1 Tax=Wickerhamomyces ciferrii (strain ATCC 14091 / BCRC 22168 / CBS 111 / JCM 3599 / NBRC 0793 / NRRL Y-1031 F-60-10) TaxID=1206466 RepID=K0KEJ3_WICCF|nr:GPI-anchored wall transfer protein 1 [Wickerhamomyces ciferrii]CCH40652.1 GPI-anchored wall transfer protein 1 [Wickerhamomyces ciferrii]
MSSLKERKQDFVTGLSGGEITEINQVTSIALVAYFSWGLINKYTNLFKGEKKWEFGSLLIDFLLNWAGLLLSVTIYSSIPGILALSILIPAISLCVILGNKNASSTQKTKAPKELTDKTYLPKKSFITAYRGGMLVITAIAILAVDFQIFPRRFAKVETWGTSLMDLGVGSFVFSMGIVSTRSVLLEKFNNVKVNYFKKAWKTVTSSITVLALGFLRLFFVKNLDYQEHVSEYGVHWNFFITLVLVGPIAIFLDPVFKLIPRSLVSLIVTFTYEWFIVNKEGFLTYLLLAPRTDFVSSNKEGIFSLFGYLAIFLAGQSTGFYVLPSVKSRYNLFVPSTKENVNKTSTTKPSLLQKLTTVSPITGLLIWFTVYGLLFATVRAQHDYGVSRRLANLPYVLWVCTYNTGSLVFYSLITKFLEPPNSDYNDQVPVSLESFNSNGMILFLVSNVSTGLVNMTINTLDASTGVSITVLFLYTLFVASVAAFLYYKKIFLKI